MTVEYDAVLAKRDESFEWSLSPGFELTVAA